MEGRSLVPLIEGKFFEPRPVIVMQLIKNPSFGQPLTKGAIAVIDGGYKLVYNLEDKKVQLFNLRLDRNEETDISQREPEESEMLRKLILGKLASANGRILSAEQR